MCPKQGLQSCDTSARSKKKTGLHSTFPRRNGYSWLLQQKSWRKESLQLIQARVRIWSLRKTLTLLSWRPWGHRGVRRRWWRPTARCKPEKKPRYMSNNWICLSKLCLMEKLLAVLSLEKLCEDHGYTYHWASGQNHISSKMARQFRKNLVDESTSTEPWRNPEQGRQDTSKSSHELLKGPRAEVEPGSGKHSVKTHKVHLQKTHWYRRAQSGTCWLTW